MLRELPVENRYAHKLIGVTALVFSCISEDHKRFWKEFGVDGIAVGNLTLELTLASLVRLHSSVHPT